MYKLGQVEFCRRLNEFKQQKKQKAAKAHHRETKDRFCGNPHNHVVCREKVRHEKERDAKEFATYIFEKYGKTQTPYDCHICYGYHLTNSYD